MIRKLISRITGRQYQYRIRLEYKDGGNNLVFAVNCTIWFDCPSYITRYRLVKKSLQGKIFENLPKYKKVNGRVFVEPICYLGWFKPNGN